MNAPAPGCYVVHPGQPAPSHERRDRLCGWLRDNGIDPGRVPLTEPIIVLTVPQTRSITTPRDETWHLQVIWFTEYYVNPDGQREANLITDEVVTLQRTVPLRVPYPTTEEAADGEVDREATQATPQVLLRDQEGAQVPHRFEGQSPQRAGESVGPRIGGPEKAGPGRGDEALPEPEEEAHQGPRPEEEVADAGEGER